MSNNEYATYRVPRQPDRSIVKKFASINRDASRSIPGLILYRSHELLWDDDQWFKQLEDQNKFHFVCVTKKKSCDGGPLTLENGRWVGMCCWLGPLSKQRSRSSGASDKVNNSNCSDSSEGSDVGSEGIEDPETETLWHAGRLYLHAAHRNSTSFSSMIDTCTRFVREYTLESLNSLPGHCRGRMHTTVSPNSGLGPLFDAAGARCVDYVTLEETLIANDALKDVPKDALSESDYTIKDRRLFEWLVDC